VGGRGNWGAAVGRQPSPNSMPTRSSLSLDLDAAWRSTGLAPRRYRYRYRYSGLRKAAQEGTCWCWYGCGRVVVGVVGGAQRQSVVRQTSGFEQQWWFDTIRPAHYHARPHAQAKGERAPPPQKVLV
jgi:hypothetical protein